MTVNVQAILRRMFRRFVLPFIAICDTLLRFEGLKDFVRILLGVPVLMVQRI